MSQFDILKTYRKSYYLTHPWKIFSEIKRNLRWAWQRIFRGWDDRVIWSIDSYLFEMLPIWLRELKEIKTGIPLIMYDDSDLNEIEIPESADNRAQCKFDVILEMMAIGFESGYKLTSASMDTYDEFDQWQIETYGSVVWDIFNDDSEHHRRMNEFGYREKMKAEIEQHQKKLDIALGLFAKYHGALWD